MSVFKFLTPSSLFIEIGQSSLKLSERHDGLELPLERLENGRLTPSCKERLMVGLRGFFNQHIHGPRTQAFCAIGARGLSLRRLALPAATKEELLRVLRLQIENEFPLPPDELAWGYLRLNTESERPNGAAMGQELVVVAVKKEVVEEYDEILSACGISPVFTLGALARSYICPRPAGPYAILDIGRNHSELISFDNGAPSAIRILSWGGDDLTRSLETHLGLEHDEAERLKLRWTQETVTEEVLQQKIPPIIQDELASLASFITGHWNGRKLYLTGKTAGLKDLATGLARALGDGVQCEQIKLTTPARGSSAAILGLQKCSEIDGAALPLVLEINKAKDIEVISQPTLWKWAALAVVLALGAFFLRYAEALLKQPGLARKLGELQAARAKLPNMDQELSFLQYLKTNQPASLEVLLTIAHNSPPGTRLDALSLNRRGDLSLRATLGNPQQAIDFRTNLINSGFFTMVVLDEQTPSADRQKTAVRISAQLTPANVRTSLPKAPAAPSLMPSNALGRGVKPGAPPITGPPPPTANRQPPPP